MWACFSIDNMSWKWKTSVESFYPWELVSYSRLDQLSYYKRLLSTDTWFRHLAFVRRFLGQKAEKRLWIIHLKPGKRTNDSQIRSGWWCSRNKEDLGIELGVDRGRDIGRVLYAVVVLLLFVVCTVRATCRLQASCTDNSSQLRSE